MSFGTKLKMYRERRGVTQRRLAQRVGIHPHHLWEIENDKANPPKIRTIDQLSEVLHLSPAEVDDLLEEVINRAKENVLRKAQVKAEMKAQAKELAIRQAMKKK